MRWLSRRVQVAGAPKIAITVAQPNCAKTPGLSGTDGIDSACWMDAFEQLDARRLPATWATVLGPDRPLLDSQLVASDTPHELAFYAATDNMASLLLAFKKQRSVFDRAKICLRTLVSDRVGVHPSVLANLGVQAMVPIGSEAQLSRTGSLRAVAWDQWEAPPTLCLRHHQLETDTQRLMTQLRQMSQQTARMHLLWEPWVSGSEVALSRLERALDHIAQLYQRGWVQVETAGAAAQQISLRAAA